jgi:hypothetical protein
MTTYTTTAIATSSATNTVTVASISNMVPGMPIVFSGTTFGGITAGNTYYIRTIVYGYPTSTITLSSLPGGAIFVLTTATGSMTATWSSGGQQMVSTVPPGESLNTSFTKINTNFDQIWAAGPVGSNIKISGDTISTLDTNGDLVLNPNGTGNIVANAHVIPDQTRIRNLGAPGLLWDTLYVEYGNIGNVEAAQLTIPVGNLHILGGNAYNILQTNGNGNLSWVTQTALAGGANTQIQFNNDGLLDGSDTFTFDSGSNTVALQNLITSGQANLNSVSNVTISGGSAGYILQTDGYGHLNWVAPLGNTQNILDQQIFGTGNTTVFDLITPAYSNSVLVAINGVQQIPGVAYNVAGNVITFNEAPAVSDLIDIRFLVGGQAGNGQPGGANGSIQFNMGDGLGGSGNLTYNELTGNLYSTNVSVSGNITASYYYGDGSYLTGVTAAANTGTITFANNTISTSNSGNAINVLGPQTTPVVVATGGNTATTQMLWATNISGLTPDQIYNGVLNGNTWGTQISVGNTGAVIGSNSVAGLKTWTFRTDGTLSGTGGVMAGNITSATDVTATANVSAVGNVAGNYILGNVAFATGIPQAYGNSNVYALLNGSAANIVPLANISYSLGNATNQWRDLWVSNSTIYMNSVPITVSAGNTLTVAGNSVITSNNLGNIGFVGDAVYDVNGVIVENADLTHGATSALIVPPNGSSQPTQLNNYYGNIRLQASANGVGVAKTWIFDGNGNLTLPSGGLLGDTYGDNANAVGLAAGPAGYAIINSYDRAQFVQADDTNVYIGTSYGDANWVWTFDPSGNLTLPSNVANINYANGVSILNGAGGGPVSQLANSIPGWSAEVWLDPYADLTFIQNGNTVGSIGFDGGADLYIDSQNGNIEFEVNSTGPGPWVINTGNVALTGSANVETTGNIFGAYLHGDGSNITGVTVTANTGNVTFNNSTIVGPSFGVVPSANSSVYIQPTVDSANVFQFDSDGNLTASGNLGVVVNSNLWNFDTNGTLTLPGNTLQLGLIGGDTGIFSLNTANITINTDGGNTWTFDTTGNLSAPGNISAAGNVAAQNFIGNGGQLANVAGQVKGSWTVTTGTHNYSFTVGSGTYYMWVEGDIPNGIIVWNATATVTNTNVPVVGQQYAWVYTGGGTTIDFSSIPNQFIGTGNTIVRTTGGGTNTNTFTFGITNNSGTSQVVNWGYTRL